MLVVIPMPCASIRWTGSYALGVLGDHNTCRLLCPLCDQESVRLFLEWFLIACNQTLTNDKTGVSVGIVLHSAYWAQYQRGSVRISLRWLSFCVSSNEVMATGTFSTGIPGTHPTSDNT